MSYLSKETVYRKIAKDMMEDTFKIPLWRKKLNDILLKSNRLDKRRRGDDRETRRTY